MNPQAPIFDTEPVEIRTSLSSVRNLPVPASTRLAPDQMLSGTFVGSCKGVTTMRGPGNTYISTYLVEVLSVELEPQ